MLRFFTFLIVLFSLIPLFAHKKGGESTTHVFTKNHGQWDNRVLFKAELTEAAVFFESNSFHYQLISRPNNHLGNNNKNIALKTRGHNFKAVFLNSNQKVSHKAYNPSEAYYNYFLGNDKSKWKGGVRKYEKIVYNQLYSGIDLIAYTEKNYLKYDYSIAPSADPNQIKILYQGVEKPIVRNGNLIISHSLGELIEEKPYAYQIINNHKVEVECQYEISEDGIVSFIFPSGYDESIAIVIDPILVFSTYSGSAISNFGMTATYDDFGNGYMGGTVFSNGYNTTTGAFQFNFGGDSTDIAISKFSSDGNKLIYATLIGGNGSESVHSMVVYSNNTDSTLIIFGATSSTNFPTSTSAFDKTKSNSSRVQFLRGYNQDFFSGSDIFITKFANDGKSIIGSTYFGGNGSDGLNIDPDNLPSTISGAQINFRSGLFYNYGDHFRGEVITNSVGDIFIASSTSSDNLSNAKNSNSGKLDGILAKFNPTLSNLEWCRYLGGSRLDAIYSIKIIQDDKILVGGGTNSFDDFPTTSNSYQETSLRGVSDGFMSVISKDGNSLDRSTFIGTDNYDQVYFVEFDNKNRLYALGQTTGEFPIKNNSISDTSAGQFIIRLDSTLDSLEYAHAFGDPNKLRNGIIRPNISPTAFLVDQCETVFVSGWGGSLSGNIDGTKILSSNMTVYLDSSLDKTQHYIQETTDGNDFYIYSISPKFDKVVYASFLGGESPLLNGPDEHVDGGTSRFDKKGIIYQSVCAGCGVADRFNTYPITDSVYRRPATSSACSNAIFKLDLEVTIDANFIIDNPTFCLKPDSSKTIKITNRSLQSDLTTWNFYGDTVVSSFIDTSITIDSPGVYVVSQVVFDSACAIGDILNLKITARPDDINILTIPDTIICYDTLARITASTNGFATKYTWSSSINFTDTIAITNDSFLLAPLKAGTNKFFILAENDITNACPKIDSAIVEYIPVEFNATLSADTACENSMVQIVVDTVNIDRFKWTFPDNSIDSVSLDTMLSFNTAGNYTFTIEYENDLCPDKGLSELKVNIQENKLAFNNLTDTLFCGLTDFEVVKNSFGGAKQFVWSNNRMLSDTLNASIEDSTLTINKNDSALYFIEISNNYCRRLDSIVVEYVEYQLSLSSIIDSSCSPFSEELNTVIVGTDSFRINYGDNRFTTIDSTPIISFQNGGIYEIELIGSNAKCNIKDTISETIEIFESVELISLVDTTLCQGDSVILKGNSRGTAKEYVWDTSPNFESPINNPNDSSIKIAPNLSTLYYLKGLNVICEAFDTVNVEIEIVDIEVEDVIRLCLEDTIDIEAMIINAVTPLNFLWSPNDSIDSGQGTATIFTSPQNDMTFQLISTSPRGCVDIDSVDVIVNTPAFTSAEIIVERDSIFKGETTQLSTNRNGSNLTYQWEPTEGIDNPTSPMPKLTVNESKEYQVTITDTLTGCIVRQKRKLFVFEVNCKEPDIFVPTAFTPNSDLSNDILYVRGANLREIEFQLFNRWGELVFETNNKNEGWDGKYKGKEVDPGVFAYQLKAICFDGQEYFTKGNITLIR